MKPDTLPSSWIRSVSCTPSRPSISPIIRRDFEKWGKVARDIGFKPR
jgi:hypothetical protein